MWTLTPSPVNKPIYWSYLFQHIYVCAGKCTHTHLCTYVHILHLCMHKVFIIVPGKECYYSLNATGKPDSASLQWMLPIVLIQWWWSCKGSSHANILPCAGHSWFYNSVRPHLEYSVLLERYFHSEWGLRVSAIRVGKALSVGQTDKYSKP